MLCDFKNRNLYLMLAAETVCFAAALTLAYLLRFDFRLPPPYAAQMAAMYKYDLPLKLGVFWALGLYRGMWRYTSLFDVRRLVEAVALSSALLVAFVAYRYGFTGFSRAVLTMDGVLTLAFTAGLRLGIRVFHDRWPGRLPRPKAPPRRVLVIGAGGLGERLLREIAATPELNLHVVGFLDDDRRKIGRTLHGRPVLGSVAELPRLAQANAVAEVLIAVGHASAEEMRRIVLVCKDSGLPQRILPGQLRGKALPELRPVDYQDLLGRGEIALDEAGLASVITDKVVLVTGCGGSIGSELCRQLVRFAPARLVLVDACEFNLYAIAGELAGERGFPRIVRVLGSVADEALMERVLTEHAPSLVLHAAAYKHVPMLEVCPWAAVTNNILGTRTLMRAAARHGVARFVLVSTDKAVRPSSIMGASKRVTERLMASMTATGEAGGTRADRTRFMAVRFGNVVGSSGSVVPLFRRQIERGGPVTVTHPDMTRYFMSIAEACQLILQASAMGRGGEIFLLEMGEPVRIVDLARDLIRLCGREPGVDVDITFTGVRPGEKLHEELLCAGENVLRTAHDKIRILGEPSASDPAVAATELDALVDDIAAAAQRQDSASIRELLRRLVPEFLEPPR